MLKRCDVKIEETTENSSQVFEKLASLQQENACLVYEGFRRAYVCSLAQWFSEQGRKKAVHDMAECLRLVIHSTSFEMRFERETGTDRFFCRELRESENAEGTYYSQDSTLLFRKTQSIEPQIFAGGSGCIVCREYFKPDNGGMLTFEADRLCGNARVRGE